MRIRLRVSLYQNMGNGAVEIGDDGSIIIGYTAEVSSTRAGESAGANSDGNCSSKESACTSAISLVVGGKTNGDDVEGDASVERNGNSDSKRILEK